MNVIRSTVFYLGYFLAMLICGVLFLPPSPFLPLAGRYRLLNLYNHFIIAWFRLVCGVRYEVRGRENLRGALCPAGQSSVRVGNGLPAVAQATGLHGAQEGTAQYPDLRLGAASAASHCAGSLQACPRHEAGADSGKQRLEEGFRC